MCYARSSLVTVPDDVKGGFIGNMEPINQIHAMNLVILSSCEYQMLPNSWPIRIAPIVLVLRFPVIRSNRMNNAHPTKFTCTCTCYPRGNAGFELLVLKTQSIY